MDIKNTVTKYNLTTNRDIKIDKIKESISIILNSGLDYEFRSTILPKLHSIEDFHQMGELVKGAKLFIIQGFRPGKTLDKAFENEISFSDKDLAQIKTIFEKYVAKCNTRQN